MKQIFFAAILSSLSTLVFGQNILLTPANIEEFTITKYSDNPNVVGRTAGGTSSNPGATSANSILLTLGGRGYTGSYFIGGSSAYISMVASQTFSSTAYGSYIRFGTTQNNSTSASEKMRIDHNGNVGIGTTTPMAKLDIAGDLVIRKNEITTAGTYNALNRNGFSSIFINVNGTVTINGIAGGEEGMLLYIFTSLNSAVNFTNDNLNAVSTDRILTHTDGTATITNRGGATLIYGNGKWRIIGFAN